MMSKANKWQLAKKITYWLLGITTVLFVVSGFGITEYRTVEFLTFGLFTKVLAFKLHEILWIPFVILLVFHIFQRYFKKIRQ